MADPTSVQSKATDAGTQGQTPELGTAPAHAMAMAYQTLAQSVAVSMQNAVAAQHAMQTLSQAVVAQAVQSIMSLTPQTTARTPRQAAPGNDLFRHLTELLSALGQTPPADTTSDHVS